ncbi:MAG: beta-lactamase, partial [Candidatus Eremiobacteraeota bacterium]|nr:beta-lactamase [Candidatus Eremiobacteraeota bacterium]
MVTAGSLAVAHPEVASAAEKVAVPSVGQAQPQFARADAVVTSFMQKYALPAAALAIAKDGRLVHARAFGYQDLAKTKPVTPMHRFRIASNSKPVTAVGVMLLVERGRVKLDDRAFDVLSDLSPPSSARVDPRLRTITIRQLLEHSAGFDSTKTDPQFDALRVAADALGRPTPATHVDIIRYMMGQPLAFDPGTKYLYSNLGYNILGRVIERVSGSPYEAFCQREVLAPAGIT